MGRRHERQVNPVNILFLKDLHDAVSMAAVSAHVPGACVGRAPHAGTGPNPAQLKAQMAALVLALAQAAKANGAAPAQTAEPASMLAVVPRIQRLAALAKAQQATQAAPAPAARQRSNDDCLKQITGPW